ncbi:MAG: hypothetical protein N4A71_26445 [Carboxylicivirga sp.]|jgi:L-rhamnose-H+ transport protein|nr:hypothetical protein [Carboxylicivirga sp.]
MNSSIILGITLIALGAFSSGSFAMPFDKVKGWKWETFWMVFSVAAYVIFPILSCLIFAPEYLQVFKSIPTKTIIWVFFLGSVYGIGNLSFGLSLRYLGLSLGYALALGLMLAIGTLIPPLIDGRLAELFTTDGGNKLILGIIIAIVGIALVAYTGFLKDKLSDKSESITEFNFTKGVLAAILVGITGSAMSLGIEQGTPISDMAIKQGTDPFFAVNPVLLILLSGTLVTTILWCGYQGFKNNSLKEYVKVEKRSILITNYLWCTLAGGLWFIQFFLYGMGKSQMGRLSFIAWGVLMALTIAFATVWGLIRKEWKGVTTKIYLLLAISLLVIILASFLIGMSAS